MAQKYIAGLDVGTTSVRCFIYGTDTKVYGRGHEHIQLLYPKPGYVEIDPDQLFNSIVNVIKAAIKDANLTVPDLTCLGISTQRSSFITWNRKTGKPFHNLITWKDLRADSLVQSWNSSMALKAFNSMGSMLYAITRSDRFLAAKVLKFMNPQVVTRLAWCIRNMKDLEDAMNDGTALFGTLDSWLLYKLKQGSNIDKEVDHVSDYSNCTTTAFFDPFTVSYSSPILKILNIKEGMLPKPVDNSYDFGCVDESVFGHELKIGCSVSDQSASMWGQCCFKKGDIKVTLGTGSFLNMNCGSECHASVHGLYPIVAWGLNGTEVTYSVEGASNDNGSIIEWAVENDLIDDVKRSADIAYSVPDSDGVFFVPAFSGLGAPFNDGKAACGFIGLKPSTTKAHMVRAMLESLAYRVAILYNCCLEETNFKFTVIKVDGGVSRNDFICQLLADLTGLNVERAADPDMTILGAMFIAGLNQGIWKNKEEFYSLRNVDMTFTPREDKTNDVKNNFENWKRATERFYKWY